ncbi:MAG: tripartite tricarboxylate transporter permease [Thermodesulfobacteriota bacterium]|nr:tripartite tricarboxylate transporter permease [Thermodesulfobacteriota bacterium]
MFEALINGLWMALNWKVFSMMLLTIPIGLILGILPGVGGKVGLALLIPFCFGMEPEVGIAFLLGMHAVVHTGSPVPAILFNTPDGPAAATCVDGFPMAQKGEAGRALGAALASSGVGGIVGAVCLALTIPVVRPVVLAFGPPEFFMMMILGLTFISVMSSESLMKGMIAGGLGMIISFVGMDPQTGVVRFAFDQLYLFDGINIVTVVIGIFAIAAAIDMGIKGGAIAHTRPEDVRGAGIWQGIKDTFIHWNLTIRCSVIGSVIGMIPGLGGDAAGWICYGHAVQSSKNRERFGKGAVEGVLAPESANNSKEGGALLPTIAFGVPGSSGMAVLLGALMILGLVPGQEMLTKHLDLVFSMVWILVFANIIAVLMCLPLAKYLAKITFIRTSIIIPFILTFGILGSYLATNHFGDIFVTLIMGGVGYGMMVFGYPRGPLVLGMVLGKMAENNLHLSLNLYGLYFLLRPMTLLLMACAISVVVYSVSRRKK